MKNLKRLCVPAFLMFVLAAFFFTCNGCGGGGEGENGGDLQQLMPGKSTIPNMNPYDSLFLTHVDDNSLMYSFFGVKDNDGVVEYCNQLELSLLNGGSLEPYLNIEFNREQRPTRFSSPDLGGEITLEYQSNSEVLATVQVFGGKTETVLVENPYARTVSEGGVGTIFLKASDSSIEETWEFSGGIKTCDDGEQPFIAVKRIIPSKFSSFFSHIVPKVRKISGDPEWTHYYIYGISKPNSNYQSWKSDCKWEMANSVVNSLAGIPGAIKGAIEGIFNDVKNGTPDNSVNAVIDKAIEKSTYIPIASQIRIVYQTLQLGGDLRNGPCSERVWETLREIQCAKHEITAAYAGSKQKDGFSPCSLDFSSYSPGDLLSAPDFDFTGSCNQPGKFLLGKWKVSGERRNDTLAGTMEFTSLPGGWTDWGEYEYGQLTYEWTLHSSYYGDSEDHGGGEWSLTDDTLWLYLPATYSGTAIKGISPIQLYSAGTGFTITLTK